MAWRSSSGGPVPAWGLLGAAALAALGAFNLAHTVRRVPPAPRYAAETAADAAMRSERRFARLRAALGAHHVRGTIGYLADLPEEAMRADAEAMRDLFLAQFTLAPVVLDTGLRNCHWAVANLHREPVAARLPPQFSVAEELGDGVWLLRKEAP